MLRWRDNRRSGLCFPAFLSGRVEVWPECALALSIAYQAPAWSLCLICLVSELEGAGACHVAALAFPPSSPHPHPSPQPSHPPTVSVGHHRLQSVTQSLGAISQSPRMHALCASVSSCIGAAASRPPHLQPVLLLSFEFGPFYSAPRKLSDPYPMAERAAPPAHGRRRPVCFVCLRRFSEPAGLFGHLTA